MQKWISYILLNMLVYVWLSDELGSSVLLSSLNLYKYKEWKKWKGFPGLPKNIKKLMKLNSYEIINK